MNLFPDRANARRVWALVAPVAVTAAVSVLAAAQQPPQFEAAVDVIVTDVHVVDRDGKPVPGLTPDKFEVSIDGRKHKVVSATFLDVAQSTAVVPAQPSPQPSAQAAAATSAPGRFYVIAIDSLSIAPDLSPGMMKAAKTFVSHLQPTDVVAVFTYPRGPRLDPTTDHAAVARTLDTIVGAGESHVPGRGGVKLAPGEVIDIADSVRANDQGPAYVEAMRRECGADWQSASQAPCRATVEGEAVSSTAYLEGLARLSVGGLRDLLTALGDLPGRKTLVLLTAGMLASDRAGVRPDVSDIARAAGQDAGRANVTVYSIFVDAAYLARNSAQSSGSTQNKFVSSARNSEVMSSFFDHFSGTAGGTLLKDLVGNGDVAFDRVIRETSTFYRLGVEPLPQDRDGKPHQLVVKLTNVRNATLRGQSWVVVPAAK